MRSTIPRRSILAQPFLRRALASIGLLVTIGCSAQDITSTSPASFADILGKRYLLTTVSGQTLPAVYYASPDRSYKAWVDSASVTFQPDDVVVFYMYRPVSYDYSATQSPGGASAQVFVGPYTVSGDTIITATNGGPDTAIVLPHGGIAINLYSHYPDELVPLGRWRFETPAPALHPVPNISAVSPTAVNVNAPDFTLTIDGYGFVPGSSVSVGGFTLTPVEQSLTHMTVVVPSAALWQAGVLYIAVVTPPPGGGRSNLGMVTVVNPGT